MVVSPATTLDDGLQMLRIKDVACMADEVLKEMLKPVPEEDLRLLQRGVELLTKYLPRVQACSPAMKQKVFDVILTMYLLPQHSDKLRLMQKRQFTSEKDSLYGICEFSMCSVKDQDIIPMCILCNTRTALESMSGQLLALAKEIDSKNLGNGYNLPVIYMVGTTGDLWQFYTVKTKKDGWTVTSSEPLYWKGFGSVCDDSVRILGLLNGMLKQAADLADGLEKGETTDTYHAREEPRPEQTITAFFGSKSEKFLLLPGQTVENIQDELLKGVDAREYGCYSSAVGGHRITIHDKLEVLKLTTIYFRKVVQETGRRHSIYT